MKVLDLISRLYRPKLFKFLLLVCFLVSLGVIEGLQSLPTSNDGMNVEERAEKTVLMHKFVLAKLEIARKKDAEGAYSPYNYFQNLREVFDKEKELGFGKKLIHYGLQEMVFLSRKSLDKGFTEHDVDIARKGYDEYTDPGREPREQAFEHLRELGWSGVLSWLFGVYLKTFMLAFVFFLILINEDRKREGEIFSLRSPASFVLAVVLYPVVISCICWNWFRFTSKGILEEAEFRRTKRKIFTLLSDDEMAKIRRFVKSGLPASAWRRQLVGQGLVFRHSLALALLVTLILIIIPRPGEARGGNLSRAGPHFMVVEQLNHNLARIQIDEDQDDDGRGFPDFLTSGFQQVILLAVCLFRLVEEVFRIGEIPKRIDHVPRRLFGLRPVLAAN